MENHEQEKDRQIQLVLNSPGAVEEDSIDLGRVFHNAKLRARVYAWVLVLCMVAGICAPLLIYQFNRKKLKVSSVVTLDYDLKYSWEELLERAATKKETQRINQARLAGDETLLSQRVVDLTAPDLQTLDLNQITSAYVLNNALSGLPLSQKIDAESLRKNIGIERILSEDSRKQQELLSGMIENKSNNAYTEAQEMTLTYNNQFIVTLKNGFSDGEGEQAKVVELKDGELRTLLNEILNNYNAYLVRTYADTRLPTDEISIIDVEDLDILESLEQLQTAEQNLYNYCASKSIQERNYRSARTGHTLIDWMESLQTVADTHINYLYSYVYAEGIAKNPEELVSNYQYQLTNVQLELEKVNENIEKNRVILENYKNDEIYIGMQESDGSRSTKDTTAYYDRLMVQQADYYASKQALESTMTDLKTKIKSLLDRDETDLEAVEEELQSAIKATHAIYQAVYEHMEELQEGTAFLNYIRHTEAQGESESFITANIKGMLIGAAGGMLVALALWFLSALAPELHKDNKEKKEAEQA